MGRISEKTTYLCDGAGCDARTESPAVGWFIHRLQPLGMPVKGGMQMVYLCTDCTLKLVRDLSPLAAFVDSQLARITDPNA
jgi:hypothetical protein